MARAWAAGSRIRLEVWDIHRGELCRLEGITLDPLAPGGSSRVRIERASWGQDVSGIVTLHVRRAGRRAAAAQYRAAAWQALARCAMQRFGGEEASIPEVYAAGYDAGRGWFLLIEEFVEGRPRRLEVDDCLRRRFKPSADPWRDDPRCCRTEYEAQRLFLARLRWVLRFIGATGWARHYAWWTGLGPTRVIKRVGTDDSRERGWTAISFPPTHFQRVRGASFVESHAQERPDLRVLARELAATNAPRAVLAVEAAPIQTERGRGRTRGTVNRFHLLTRRELRHAWLLDMVAQGVNAGMLTEAEAEQIRNDLENPLLETYLRCLAVHLAMLPVTPLAVGALALGLMLARGLTWTQGLEIATLAFAVFAVAPLSPGSLARGLFVLAVVLHRRSLRGFRVALACSFWRYVGYAAFPLQMASSFPALARFLAARAATHAARKIPLWGRAGGWLEHFVFDLTFNLPLTLARRWRQSRADRIAMD